MNTPPAIFFVWDGGVMVPIDSLAKIAERSYKPGRVYRLIVEEQRSAAEHRYYMAIVNEGFMNLPEQWKDRFATVDHLRKWCLIKSGFRTEVTHPCETVAEAVRAAKLAQALDDYCIAVRHGRTLTVYLAKSQSYAAMGATEFRASKKAVIELLAGMLDCSVEELSSARAA